MTKVQALDYFNEYYLPEIKKVEARNSGRVDKVRRAEGWSIYTDSLCKDGQITASQYHRWSNPF